MYFLCNLIFFWLVELVGFLIRDIFPDKILMMNKRRIWRNELVEVVRLYDFRSRTLKKFCILKCDNQEELIVKQRNSDFVGKKIRVLTDGQVTVRVDRVIMDFFTPENTRLFLLVVCTLYVCIKYYIYLKKTVIIGSILTQVFICVMYRNVMAFYYKENA